MTASLSDSPETLTPTAEDTLAAGELNRKLTQCSQSSERLRIQLTAAGHSGEAVELPATVSRLVRQILAEMAQGNPITILAHHTELTTQQAADLLGVSRPFLIEQMEQGRLPFHRVGTHRRVRLRDVLDYKRRIDESRQEALAELTAQAEELGMGY
jgi:excisionase family DNA binding protein